jgi:hypothetical protein
MKRPNRRWLLIKALEEKDNLRDALELAKEVEAFLTPTTNGKGNGITDHSGLNGHDGERQRSA